jgi:hypothetical protein
LFNYTEDKLKKAIASTILDSAAAKVGGACRRGRCVAGGVALRKNGGGVAFDAALLVGKVEVGAQRAREHAPRRVLHSLLQALIHGSGGCARLRVVCARKMGCVLIKIKVKYYFKKMLMPTRNKSVRAVGGMCY